MPNKNGKSFSVPKFNKSIPTPIKKNPTPLPANVPTNTMPTMGDSIKQGFGLGIGLEGARAAVGVAGSMMGGSTEQIPQQPNSNEIISGTNPTQTQVSFIDCNIEKKLLNKCMEENFDNEQHCNDFINLFKKCNNIN